MTHCGVFEECDYCLYNDEYNDGWECEDCIDASNFEPLEDFEDSLRRRKTVWLNQAA